MSLNLHLPESTVLKPCITVFGVGGAGCNAVNNMISSNLEGAKFVVANTDSQSLHLSNANHKIQLGANLTKGLGAGASPDVGKAAAEEAIDEIDKLLTDSNMVFITAGMGGGTGTGAAPVIARMARERGILTVAVVTKPFHFEGIHRMRLADDGLNELQRFVDTLIIIPNQNLFKIANAKTTFADAFKMADDVLHAGVRGITDLMIMPGLINLDFADIRAVMSEMGKAMMGTGEAQDENRAIAAAEAAISNPLLDSCSMKGARGVLINITGGYDMTLFEVDEAANRIREEVDPEANIIFGSAFNPELEGTIRVSVVATGIEDLNFQAIEKQTKAIEPKPSTIEQMQQLYRSEPIELTKTSSTPMEFDLSSVSVSSSTQENLDIEENNEETQEISEEKNSTEEENNPDIFFSPRKSNTKFEEETTSTKSVESEHSKSPFSLFTKMVSSVGLNFSKDEKEIYVLSEDKQIDEEELVTEEMLNIPAYQRRK
jgi:cell division protein FtsZ